MATHSAPDLNTKPLPMGGYGNAAIVYGSVTPTSGALASVYRPVRIPAGMTVTGLKINNDDLDTGGTAFAVKIGYTPVSATDGPAQNDDLFLARNHNSFRCRILQTCDSTQSSSRKMCTWTLPLPWRPPHSPAAKS